MSASLSTQVGAIAKRSVVRTLRQPVLVVPQFVFPIFMLFVLSGAGGQATKIKGFPTQSYITFVLGATLVQAAASATTQAGNALGSDIETGFLQRLSLTPMRTSALVAAQLAGAAVIGAVGAILMLVVGIAGGASIKAGVGGAVVLVLVVLFMDLAFGSLGLLIAARAGSSEKVQAVFALILGLLFMSSMVMPRNLITHEWFKVIATVNPLSYLVEANRSLLITGWDAQALALGLAVAAGLFLIGLTTTVATLRGRIS